MSGNEELITPNPAAIAEEEAKQSFLAGPNIVEDRRRLIRLDKSADQFGFINEPYFVQAGRSLAIPRCFEKDEEVIIRNFDRLAFEGLFKCYSKVEIGRIVGASSVQALCLTFDEVTLLPYFDDLPEDRLLYVPVMAVDSIDKTAV